MNWINKTFGSKKPIIAMCHMPPLPGDSKFDLNKGINYIVDQLKTSINILQDNGADALLFSNEFSMPYLLDAEMITVASMARIIGELLSEIKIPFGIDYMYDTKAAVDLASATEASFIRGVISGTYASDLGIWNTNAGKISRYIYSRRMEEKIGVFYSIFPQGTSSLDFRNKIDIINTTLSFMKPDAICLSASLIKQLINNDKLKYLLKRENYSLIADGGCDKNNIQTLIQASDGAIIGTAFKRNCEITNNIDANRVNEIITIVNNI